MGEEEKTFDMNIDEEATPSGTSRPTEQQSLWADYEEQRLAAIKKSLEERFIVPPFTILDTRQGYWREGKRLWLELGIKSEVGRETGMNEESKDWDGIRSGKPSAVAYDGQKRLNEIMGGKGFDAGVSIFDPVLCELMYKWFCPAGGTVLDPFAGGSVRGIVAEYLGFKYTGIELRPEQVESNRKQAAAIKLMPDWIVGDSDVRLDEGSERYDFLFSCPPYFNLEVYSDLPGELSAIKQYDDFLVKYTRIIQKAVARLRPNRFACYVVSNLRDARTGYFYNFIADTIAAFHTTGARLYNDAILVNVAGTLPIRIRRQFNSGRKLGKCHQNILVFFNGNPDYIKRDFGEV